jgi:predicted RNA-binding protein
MELVDRCGMPEEEVRPVLRALVDEDLVVEGQLLPDETAPQYRWAARWAREAEVRTSRSRRKLQAIVRPSAAAQEEEIDVESEPALAFHDHVINAYRPPKDKRFCVFLQCSVRRPFSSSPSHASMRRAISIATGYDPRHDFERCPVHAVVLASKIGPVPYELENVHPANVRAGGVKHLDRETYARVQPILAERMAQYIMAHRDSYDRMATFTEGRYAEVMEEAKKRAAIEFPVLPRLGGPRVIRMGRSTPLRYWQKYWIQLYLEIVSWLGPVMQAQAGARLRAMDVEYQ